MCRLKILSVIPSVNPQSGGPTEGLLRIASHLQAMGHCIEIATVDEPSSEWVANCPIKVHACGPAAGTFGACPRLLSFLETNRNRYDEVIVEGLWTYHAYAAWKAFGRGRYSIWTHGMLDPYFKRAYPLKHIKKVAYWLLVQGKVINDARHVLFTTQEEMVLAAQSFRPYRANGVVLGYGTDTPTGNPGAQRAAFSKAFPDAIGGRNLLFMSRIHEKKGLDLSIRAFANVFANQPDFRLIVAGDGSASLKADLRALAESLGISSRVIWTGLLQGDLKWGAFRSSEALVLNSHQENFGVAIAEALACGLPVMISNRINLWREVEGSQAGFVAADTESGAVEVFEKWNSLDAKQREEMSRRAMACFQESFEMRKVAGRLADLLGSPGLSDGAVATS